MSIPNGYAKIRLTIKPTGEFKKEVIREGMSVCPSSGKNLLDVLKDLGEEEDSGKTAEFYEQNRVKPQKTKAIEEDPSIPTAKEPEKKLDAGYGV